MKDSDNLKNVVFNKMETTNEIKNESSTNSPHNGLTKMDELGSTWFLGNSESQPLATCLKNAEDLKHKFIAAFDYHEDGMKRATKVYGSYKNSKLFYKNTKNCDSEERCFYVVIPEKSPCCMFADLEWSLDWKTPEQIKEKFIQVAGDTISECGIHLNKEDYLFSNACEQKTNKGSLHVHVPNVCFKNIEDQQKFFNGMYIRLEKQSDDWFFIDSTDKNYVLKTFVDFGVYNKNRQIRLPYSSKKKKVGNDFVGLRPLIPEDEDNFDFQDWTITDMDSCDVDDPVDVSKFPDELKCSKRNMWSKALVQCVLDDNGLEVSVDTFKGKNLISLKNKTGSRVCPIGGETNKSDNAYCVIKDNKLHYHCHDEGCKGKSVIVHQFEDDPMIIRQKLIDECAMSGCHATFAELFQNLYGNNIYITSKKDRSFYHWNEVTLLWELEPKETLTGLIKIQLSPILDKIAKSIVTKMHNTDDKGVKAMLNAQLKELSKSCKNLKNAPFLNNIITFYMSFPINKDFETKIINKVKHELPIKDGNIINLKTLVVRKRTKKDYWSEECPVNFLGEQADLGEVHKFMDSITVNSADLKDYHRRLWGYMMTGEISDRSLHIFWGDGRNGKTSIVNIFTNIVGDLFSQNLAEDVMIHKNSRGASPEMMDLLHARCGIMPESDKKEKLNSKRVKTITGDDDIKARHLFGHLVQFRTQCKPIWPTNFKPIIDVEDKAITDRLKLVPFLASFEKNAKNSKYIKNLQNNCLDQFFTWFCSGAKDWYNGDELLPCKEMMEEMNKYIIECDAVAEFIDDTYDVVSEDTYATAQKLDKINYRTERGAMYGAFMGWINDNNNKDAHMGKKEFYKALNSKYTPRNIHRKYYYLLREKGFVVNEDSQEDDEECVLPL